MLNRVYFMNNSSPLFLRFVIYLIGVAVLVLLLLILPPVIFSEEVGYYRPVLIAMYFPAIPFFLALYQALKLLGYIDKNKAFSQASVNTLKQIKYCGVAVSALCTISMPYVYYAAERDDAPGVILIGLVIIFTSFVIATAAALFQKLLQNAVDIKAENDLTV